MRLLLPIFRQAILHVLRVALLAATVCAGNQARTFEAAGSVTDAEVGARYVTLGGTAVAYRKNKCAFHPGPAAADCC